MSQKLVEMNCPFQVKDNHGRLNCVAIDSTIGYCDFKLCKRQLWQMRNILRQAAENLRLQFNFNPVLLKGEKL